MTDNLTHNPSGSWSFRSSLSASPNISPTPGTPSGRSSHRVEVTRPVTSDARADVAPTVPREGRGTTRTGRARGLASRLTLRDWAVLCSLADFRLMTGQQLQRLHVTSDNPATSARRTRAILQRLHELGVLVRLSRRIGGIRAGSEGQLWGLSGLGYTVLAHHDTDNQRPRRGRTVWETRPAFQDHLLAIGELYIELTEHCGHHRDVELLTYETEPTAWRSFAGTGGQRLPVKPDAFVALGVGDFEQRSFIEIDLGTESLPTIARKCQRYIDYWRSGREQQEHGVFPRIWWLATTERRAERLATVIDRLPTDHQALFGIGTTEEAVRLLTTMAEEAAS